MFDRRVSVWLLSPASAVPRPKPRRRPLQKRPLHDKRPHSSVRQRPRRRPKRPAHRLPRLPVRYLQRRRVAADEALANAIRGKITSGELTGEAGAIAELGAAANQFPDSAALGATADLLFAAVDAEVQRQLAGDDTAAAGALIQSIEPLPGAANIVPELRATLGDAERRLAGATVISASLLEITEAVPPVYPRGALRREMQGWVDVEFTVTADGSTSDIVVTNSSNNTSIFNRSTLQAVSQWRFRPRMFRGQPIDQRVTTRVGYRLE